MKTWTLVAIATGAMVGVASAQPKAPAPAPAPAKVPAAEKAPAPAPAKASAPAPAKAPAPAPAKAPAPTPAKAPAQAPAKAPAPAPAKAPAQAPARAPAPAPAKAPAPAPVPAKQPPPKAPAPPPPPPELDTMAKASVGFWRCKGDEWDSMTGTKGPVTATNVVKLDLDKWWLAETLEVRGRMTFKMLTYSTYDALSRKWRRLAIMNGGTHMVGTADAMKDGKMTWNLDLIGPMGAGLFRDHMDVSDPRAGMKVWGEASMDKGRSWTKVYEMTCRK